MKKSETGDKAQKSQGQPGATRKRFVDIVTGPTSGVGILLIRKLLAMGDEVRVIVLSAGEKMKRLPAGVIPYVADITLKNPDDENHIREACTGADRVFHLAGITDLRVANNEDYINTNVIGTENVLKGCVEGNPANKRIQFIFLSSVAVYGQKRSGEALTEDSETKPNGAYGESKLMAELVIKSFADAHPNIKYTILRASNMYGPYYETSFNKIFKYLKEEKLRLIGSGNNHLPLVHVDDVVDALLAAMDEPKAENNIYNVSDGDSHTQKQLYEKAAGFLGVPPPHKHVHPVLAVVRANVFKIGRGELKFLMSDRIISVAKIKNDIGFTPKRTIDKEGKELVEEFLKRYRDGIVA